MFLIKWYLREALHRLRTRHGPVWSTLHDREVCRCGERCLGYSQQRRIKRRNQGRHW